ncbi:hypothetical protein Bca4012_089193 [Brassica carinata]|uniref:(rape) hypothetical protein n=1 Tax=Brassica napus TaxID=3708 RepID=A0A816RFJ5_BRANA|nr:unnamed protein product [Brassica napus]
MWSCFEGDESVEKIEEEKEEEDKEKKKKEESGEFRDLTEVLSCTCYVMCLLLNYCVILYFWIRY